MSNCDKKKTYVLVKLTDSALNAIENHLTSNLPPPSISFKPKQNEGVLSFPNMDSSFKFNLSTVDAGGPQGSFECLKQSKCGFIKLGAINYKMQIHANEDVYERTKVRMTENQIQSKKYCINHIGATKVKKIAQSNGSNNHHNSNINSNNNHNHNSHNSNSNSNSSSSSNNNNNNNNNSNTTISNSNSNTSNTNNNTNPRPDPAIIKRSLRERVVHLLALRPYKKPELLAKLNKEGVKDKEKKQLSQVFTSVARLKENAFHLAPHVWNEVNVSDWPFYTQEQRDLVRKRKDVEMQRRTTTVNNNNSINNNNSNINTSINGNGNGNSNNNTNNSNSNNSSVSKRSVENNLGWSADKKQRLSDSFTNNITNITNSINNTNNHNTNHTNNNNNNNNHTNNNNNSTSNNTNNFKSVPCDIMKDWSIKPSSTPNSSPDSGTGSDGNLSFKSTTNFDLPDYANRYVEITTFDQLKRYKDEFNREYKEYRRLHRDIDLVAKKFSSYELKLKSLPEGSEAWNRTLAEVFAEYDTIKKDFKYLESKQRAHYLHKKLSHIKKLVQEFNKCNSLSNY